MITGIAHVCIVTEDLDETLAFYQDVLGFTKQFDFIKDGKLFGYYLKISDGNYIEVFQTDSLPDGRHPLSHFCLETDDIDAVYEKLTAAGAHVRDEKKLGSDKSWQIWTRDPNGINFEFHQYTDESSQKTGEACIVNW